MSEASDRAQMEQRLLERSLEDEGFRQRLLSDPKAAVEEELGTRLPENVRVVAVEETPQTIYVELPSLPRYPVRPSFNPADGLPRFIAFSSAYVGGYVPFLCRSSPGRAALARYNPPLCPK